MRWQTALIALLLLLVCNPSGVQAANFMPPNAPYLRTDAVVSGSTISGRAAVVDGDTIDINQRRIRLRGVDAPDLTRQCKNASGELFPCGQEAASALAAKIGSDQVTCSQHDLDGEGRIWSTCISRGENLNLWLVSQGLANAVSGVHGTIYMQDERAAREAKRGFWAGDFGGVWSWQLETDTWGLLGVAAVGIAVAVFTLFYFQTQTRPTRPVLPRLITPRSNLRLVSSMNGPWTKPIVPYAPASPPKKAVKAIETRYKGYRFRSRTEARWAVFLGAAGVEFEYEKEGYDLDGRWYLPDFWLPKLGAWLEIKGEEPTPEECELCRKLSIATGRDVLLAIGPPNPEEQVLLFKFRRTEQDPHEGMNASKYHFASDSKHADKFWLVSNQSPAVPLGFATAEGGRPVMTTEFKRAYSASRAARFEHGENPKRASS